MNDRTRYFLLGTLAAGVLTATTFDVSALEAVSSRVTQRGMTPELRLGIDLGILESSDVRLGLVDVPIARRDLARVIQQTLFMMGSPVGSRLSDLGESGIFEIGNGRKTISRKQALEALCRVVISLNDNGFLTLPTAKSAGFSDYHAPEKYGVALKYLQDKRVVRGYPDGAFGASRALSKREAVYLFYRLYEQVVFERAGGVAAGVLNFADIPVDHPVRIDLELIEKTGGFARVGFGASFDGNGPISRKDAVEILKGIVAKQGKLDESVIPPLQNPLAPLARREMAIMMDGLLPASGEASADGKNVDGTEVGGAPSTFAYIDVPAGSIEGRALENLARHKVFLGYSDGRLNGAETVSRFEMVGVLASVLKAGGATSAVEEPKILARKSDIAEFAEMLRAKKARIRGILDRKRFSE